MILRPCLLAHPDDGVQCDWCSPEVIWGNLGTQARELLLSLPATWDARELHERLTQMQTDHAICEVKVGRDKAIRWEPSELGRAVAEYGRAQVDADRDHAFQVILGERDNLSVPEIWEGLSAEAKRWVLDPSPGARIHPAHELSGKGLADRNMNATSLAGHVAEHGRTQ